MVALGYEEYEKECARVQVALLLARRAHVRLKSTYFCGKTASESYELEYGTDTIEIHLDAANGKRILMVDDLLATGGTMAASLKLVRRVGGEPIACCFAIELGFLEGNTKLDVPCHTLKKY